MNQPHSKNTILLPQKLNNQTVATLCQQIEDLCKPLNKGKAFYLDAAKFGFIDAFAMTVLFNEILYVKSQGYQPYIRNHLNSNNTLKEPIQFMDDSEFFLHLRGRKLHSESNCRDSSLAIQRLAPQETIAWLHYTAMPWLATNINVPSDNLIEIRICIEELLNNIRDHSDVQFASIFIQHYPRMKYFKICISDNGIGLINRIQQSHTHFSDSESIQFALSEGCTTKSSPRNAGMGLFTLTQTVCNNGGDFMLRTGAMHALINNNANNNEPFNINYLQSTFLKGTAFEITLYTDKLNQQQTDTEAFSWD